jgi:hypothetical protein
MTQMFFQPALDKHTWQLIATYVIQDMQDHQATTNPKSLEYLGPAALAAQM